MKIAFSSDASGRSPPISSGVQDFPRRRVELGVLDGSTKMDQPDVESFPIGDDSWGFAVGANSTYAGEPIAITLNCVNAG